ncbi:MAG: hypothetical protein ABI811_22665 [Acidobacteriota bacterium]
MMRRLTLFLLAALLFANDPAPLYLTATTANIPGAPDQVRLEILRWSTDEERDRLMAAWELRLSTPANTKGKAATKGKGAGRGAAPASGADAISPSTALARALQETTTVGYLWSSEMAGYALRYAGKIANPDGSQRVLLITQRRLGAMNQRWNLDAANSDEFTVIELRLDAKGQGEGRTSLAGKLAADASMKMLTPESGQPVVLRNVKLAKEAK